MAYTFVNNPKSFGKYIKRINKYLLSVIISEHFIILFGKATLASVPHT